MEYQIDGARQILERTPRVVRSMVEELSDDWHSPAEDASSWSPRDVLTDLVGAERTSWIPRIRQALDGGEHRLLESLDCEAEMAASASMPLGALLDEFSALRTDSLRALDTLRLAPESQTVAEKKSEFGIVQLRELLASWAVHDLSHVSRIIRVVAKRYDEAVEPWRQYLRVIR